MLHGKAKDEIGGKIDELADTGLGAVGANKPGEAEPVIDTGNIIGPEGEMEENMEQEFHGDRINLAKAPSPKPTPKVPETPVQRVDLSDIPGVKTVQHPVEITTHGPSWDRTHRMNVNGERAVLLDTTLTLMVLPASMARTFLNTCAVKASGKRDTSLSSRRLKPTQRSREFNPTQLTFRLPLRMRGKQCSVRASILLRISRTPTANRGSRLILSEKHQENKMDKQKSVGGSIEQVAEAMTEALKKLSPARKAQLRKELVEHSRRILDK